MKKLVDNILTNLTSEEINQRQIDEQNFIASRFKKEQEKEQNLANKQSALNKLKALGLNDAEINSILGK
jgi:hypothetical protein